MLSTPRPWYAKGVFETDENLDPRKATTGYAVLVSLLAYCQRVPWALSALADKPLTHCVRWCARARAAQLTDLTRIWWQQLSVTELVEAMKVSPEHAAAMCLRPVPAPSARCAICLRPAFGGTAGTTRKPRAA